MLDKERENERQQPFCFWVCEEETARGGGAQSQRRNGS